MSSLYRINYTLSLFGISNTFLLWSGFWQGSRSSKSKAHILIFNSACWRYLVTFQERPNTQLVRHPFVVVGFVSSRSGLTAGWNLAACTRPYQLYTHSAHNMVRKKHTHTIKHINIQTFLLLFFRIARELTTTLSITKSLRYIGNGWQVWCYFYFHICCFIAYYTNEQYLDSRVKDFLPIQGFAI